MVKTEIERREALLLHSLYVALQGQQDALTPDMLKHFSFRAGGKFPELIAAGVVQLPFIDGDATIESLSMNLRSWESNLVSGILNQIPSIVTLATEYGVRVTELQSWDWHGVDYDTVRRLGLLIKAAGEVGRSITNGTNVEVKARNFGDDSIGLGTISVGSYDIVHPGYYKKLEKDDRAIARHVASFRSVAPVRELHEKFNVRVKNVQSNTHEGRDHADYTDVKLVTTALSGFDQAERLSGAKFSFMSEGTRSLHPTDLRDALDGWEARARSMHKIRRVNQLPELEDIPLLRKMPLGPQFTEFLRRYDALVAELTAEPKPAVEAEKPESS